MNADIEFHIRHSYPWSKLPAGVRQSLGNSQKEYDKAVISYSIKNQLKYKGNLVRHVKKDERGYYEEVLRYSREHLMLFPYHLSNAVVKGLRITPFAYYCQIMSDIMTQEKSYDALPNFTAADCLRLMGIGRNQYIELMNQCRSSKKFFRKKPPRELLPVQPIDEVVIEPWWRVQTGYITEDDVKSCSVEEKKTIDQIIDEKEATAGDLNFKVLHNVYRMGLVYLEVPIADDDCIIVPPLEGFVMNRVMGDYFETLLYKIFVSIDEHTTVAELASVLEIDLQLVKNAVSMYCRLGFAKKKGQETPETFHSSWRNLRQQNPMTKKPAQEQLLIDWTTTINEETNLPESSTSPDNSSIDEAPGLLNSTHSKRIAFLFDSTLTAFLMMGNLSPGLKSHAVTMFEVGKLSDETLDSFLTELEKVDSVAEGEAQRYFDHAIALRDTIRYLRYNKDLQIDNSNSEGGVGIDLLRCESLLGLEPATCARVLNKNYSLLVSMAPLSNEIRPVSSCIPQHLGPAIPEVNSVWFKLFIYHVTGNGPPSLLLVKGTKLKRLPKVFQGYERLLVTTWGHDPAVIATSNILLTLNEALSHSAVLVQGHGYQCYEGETHNVPFPLIKEDRPENSAPTFEEHPAIQKLATVLDLKHTCGYVTLLKTGEDSDVCSESDRTVISPSTAKSSKETANHAAAADAIYDLGSTSSPQNGVNDPISAAVLANELDSLDIVSSSSPCPDRSKLSLDIKDDYEKGAGDHVICSVNSYKDLASRWVLLDCSYGVPLFHASVNRQVYERIVSQGLCNKDSLEELLQSSRKLTLQLLQFIAEHQDLPAFQEHSHENAMLPSSTSANQSVPLPTHNLIFCNGKLSNATNL